jgi:hypothetical protein
MSGINGILGLNDNEYPFLNTLGQAVVYDAVNQYLTLQQADLAMAMSMFVEETTENFKERYKLPGGGKLGRLSGQSQAPTVKAYGGWDVAYPLEDFGAQVASDRIDSRYMTTRDLQRHLDTVTNQYVNSLRFEMLKALFNSTAGTFVDPRHGSLTIERLANGDSVVYPPVLGIETEATDTHYLESGYAASGISDTNDPYVTMVAELVEHFGVQTGNSEIVTFINSAQTAKTNALVDFVQVQDNWIQPGTQTAIPLGPGMSLPGTARLIGRHQTGTWVVEWAWIPANYMVAIHLMAPKPLKMRVHPAYTGLARGLALVSESDIYPFDQSHYEAHFGFGVGNRLNGVVMELGTGGTYTVPTAYQ